VEIIRNTPFVVQLFFIVFGLPNMGLKMTAGEAALLAMVVNLGRTAPRSSAQVFR
jgi:polar amino acid transport system permease protein